MVHPHSPEKFTGKSTEEIQEHFDEIRLNGPSNLKRYSRKLKAIDIDNEFSKVLTVMDRELDKLLDMSHLPGPLDPKNHEAVIAYAKLIGSLKKQMIDAMRDMNPEDVEKLADEN